MQPLHSISPTISPTLEDTLPLTQSDEENSPPKALTFEEQVEIYRREVDLVARSVPQAVNAPMPRCNHLIVDEVVKMTIFRSGSRVSHNKIQKLRNTVTILQEAYSDLQSTIDLWYRYFGSPNTLFPHHLPSIQRLYGELRQREFAVMNNLLTIKTEMGLIAGSKMKRSREASASLSNIGHDAAPPLH